MKGIVNFLLVVIYFYGGLELIVIIVSEVDDFKKVIFKVICGVMGWIIFFYIILLFLFLIIFFWNILVGIMVSLFVMVFEKMNIFFVVDIVNFVIILVLFFFINFGVYVFFCFLYFCLKDKKGFMSKLGVLNKY